MKKLFQIGLLILLFIAIQVVVPPRAGPIYQDADIQCVFSPDQLSVDLMPIAYATASYDLIALRQGDVEKSSLGNLNVIFSSRQSDVMQMSYQDRGNAKTSLNQKMRSHDRAEGPFRLDIGEPCRLLRV